MFLCVCVLLMLFPHFSFDNFTFLLLPLLKGGGFSWSFRKRLLVGGCQGTKLANIVFLASLIQFSPFSYNNLEGLKICSAVVLLLLRVNYIEEETLCPAACFLGFTSSTCHLNTIPSRFPNPSVSTLIILVSLHSSFP